jgi:hypothetical protein
MQDMKCLHVDALSVRFGATVVFENLSFSVDAGSSPSHELEALEQAGMAELRL